MEQDEYFFYEWLIIDKGMTSDQCEKTTEDQWKTLRIEYREALKIVTIIPLI